MSACQPLIDGATAGVAASLRAVDCVANETTADAFARLFGGQGALTPALTILLTLYIAIFAIGLLTGRSRIGIASLTPRMMTLGLVLTFATSWVAYQSVVWTLATGAPDQIAGVLMGTKGSATGLFADRVDLLLNALAERAGANGTATPSGTSFTPTNLMWLAALMLLLATVGVLVTARIVLAVLLALGPVFVVMALFQGTRGLFVGWLRGLVMAAITPLFAVLAGGIMLQLAVPMVSALQAEEAGRAALALFLIAAVHVALMMLVLRVLGTMVSAWGVFGLAVGDRDREPGLSKGAAPGAAAVALPASAAPARTAVSIPTAALTPVAGMLVPASVPAPDRPGRAHWGGMTALPAPDGIAAGAPSPAQPGRSTGVGSRYRPAPTRLKDHVR